VDIKKRIERLERPALRAKRCPLVIFTNDGLTSDDDEAAASAEASGRRIIIINVTERQPSTLEER
jgi:hypothetical protein